MDNKNLLLAQSESGKLFIKALIAELKSEDKSSSGSLINSLNYKVIEVGDHIITNILANDYLTQVDKGRKPGIAPPAKAIIPWVKKRNIKIKNNTDEQTAFVIAKSIGKKGIKPTHIIEKTKKKVMNNITKLITAGVAADIEEILNQTFKEL